MCLQEVNFILDPVLPLISLDAWPDVGLDEFSIVSPLGFKPCLAHFYTQVVAAFEPVTQVFFSCLIVFIGLVVADLSSTLCVQFTFTPLSSWSFFQPCPPVFVTVEFPSSWLPQSPTSVVSLSPSSLSVLSPLSSSVFQQLYLPIQSL